LIRVLVIGGDGYIGSKMLKLLGKWIAESQPLMTGPINERHTRQPISQYAGTKFMVDRLLRIVTVLKASSVSACVTSMLLALKLRDSRVSGMNPRLI
jgi:UDP-glucose 4-epimerase